MPGNLLDGINSAFLFIQENPLDPEVFLSVIHSSPSMLRDALHWRIKQIIKARTEICDLLRGKINKIFTDPPARQYGMGALPPGS